MQPHFSSPQNRKELDSIPLPVGEGQTDTQNNRPIKVIGSTLSLRRDRRDMAKVFVSYSRKDIEFARRLTANLTKSELECWIDWKGVPPTMDRWKEINRAIEEADIFLFLISPDSIKSPVCTAEIKHAKENGKRLIPLLVRDIGKNKKVPELSHLNYIFFRKNDDFDAAIQKLLASIITDYKWVAAHRRLQLKALEWERNHKVHSLLLRDKDLQYAELQLATNSSKEPYPTDLQREYVFNSQKAADRQRKIVTDISIAGIIVLAALAGFGFVKAGRATSQVNIAQTERANAEVSLVVAKIAQANAESAEATAVANEQEAKKQVAISRSQLLVVNSQLHKDNDTLNLLLSIESFNLVKIFSHSDRILAEHGLLHSLNQVSGIQLSGHEDFIYTLAFSPDGLWLATGSYDNTARLWDMKNLTVEPIVLSGHDSVISILSFSPNGQW